MSSLDAMDENNTMDTLIESSDLESNANNSPFALFGFKRILERNKFADVSSKGEMSPEIPLLNERIFKVPHNETAAINTEYDQVSHRYDDMESIASEQSEVLVSMTALCNPSQTSNITAFPKKKDLKLNDQLQNQSDDDDSQKTVDPNFNLEDHEELEATLRNADHNYANATENEHSHVKLDEEDSDILIKSTFEKLMESSETQDFTNNSTSQQSAIFSKFITPRHKDQDIEEVKMQRVIDSQSSDFSQMTLLNQQDIQGPMEKEPPIRETSTNKMGINFNLKNTSGQLSPNSPKQPKSAICDEAIENTGNPDFDESSLRDDECDLMDSQPSVSLLKPTNIHKPTIKDSEKDVHDFKSRTILRNCSQNSSDKCSGLILDAFTVRDINQTPLKDAGQMSNQRDKDSSIKGGATSTSMKSSQETIDNELAPQCSRKQPLLKVAGHFSFQQQSNCLVEDDVKSAKLETSQETIDIRPDCPPEYSTKSTGSPKSPGQCVSQREENVNGHSIQLPKMKDYPQEKLDEQKEYSATCSTKQNVPKCTTPEHFKDAQNQPKELVVDKDECDKPVDPVNETPSQSSTDEEKTLYQKKHMDEMDKLDDVEEQLSKAQKNINLEKDENKACVSQILKAVHPHLVRLHKSHSEEMTDIAAIVKKGQITKQRKSFLVEKGKLLKKRQSRLVGLFQIHKDLAVILKTCKTKQYPSKPQGTKDEHNEPMKHHHVKESANSPQHQADAGPAEDGQLSSPKRMRRASEVSEITSVLIVSDDENIESNTEKRKVVGEQTDIRNGPKRTKVDLPNSMTVSTLKQQRPTFAAPFKHIPPTVNDVIDLRIGRKQQESDASLSGRFQSAVSQNDASSLVAPFSKPMPKFFTPSVATTKITSIVITVPAIPTTPKLLTRKLDDPSVVKLVGSSLQSQEPSKVPKVAPNRGRNDDVIIVGSTKGNQKAMQPNRTAVAPAGNSALPDSILKIVEELQNSKSASDQAASLAKQLNPVVPSSPSVASLPPGTPELPTMPDVYQRYPHMRNLPPPPSVMSFASSSPGMSMKGCLGSIAPYKPKKQMNQWGPKPTFESENPIPSRSQTIVIVPQNKQLRPQIVPIQPSSQTMRAAPVAPPTNAMKPQLPSLEELITSGQIEPGENVLSLHTPDKTFFASLLPSGIIQGGGGEMFLTPLRWCVAFSRSLNMSSVKKGTAYARILYKGKPLSMFSKPNISVQASVSNAVTHSENPSEANSVASFITKCKSINMISDFELISQADDGLPDEFWTCDDLRNWTVPPDIIHSIDVW